MSANPSNRAWVPEACTLPTVAQPLRVAEFDALFSSAVVGSERLAPHRLRLSLRGGTDLEATVRDLTARETQCCSFFAFAIDAPHPDQVRLDIEVPAGRVDVLDELADRVAAVGGAR